MLVCETGVCSMSRSCSQCTALGSADIRSDYHKVKTNSEHKPHRVFEAWPSAVWAIRVTKLSEEDGKGMEGRRRVCLVARIRGRRQQQI